MSIYLKKMGAELQSRAKKIRAVALDSDGVIFSNRIFIGEDGTRFQQRSRTDGQGISLLRAAGIHVAVISAGSTVFLNTLKKILNSHASVLDGTWARAAVLGGKHVHAKDKVTLAEQWLSDIGASWDACAYMGDDLSDYRIITKVGLAAAPHQAEDVIKRVAHYIAPREGGDGAVRDLANLILEAQGVDVTQLAIK